MRLILAALSVTCALTAAEDARELVRRALANDDRTSKIGRDYNFVERGDISQLDAKGNVTKRELRTFDVTLQEGSPYRRLIARDDKPLSPEEDAREEEKLRQAIEQRRKETPSQRVQRIAEWERRRERQREPAREIPDAFDFRITGAGEMDGVDVWIVEATPRPGYKPKLSSARFFPKLRGTIWISKRDPHPVRLEAETLDTISVGAFLLRLAKGTRVLIEQTRVDDEIWQPKLITWGVSARIALVKVYRARTELTYSKYRKFEANSRVSGFK